jgi:nucleoside-diphosphate-sugar epimerase
MTPRPEPFDVVTGAFSYSGAAIALELQARGRKVRTLTGHPGRAPKKTAVEVRPLDFDDPTELAESMRGANTLYNTYWVRFAHGLLDHDVAVANTRTMFDAALMAGVERIVHVSITNPSLDSPYPYFRGKAEVEQLLAEIGISHAIVRPAILFGGDDVLVNNIAWLLRHVPIFAIGGTGDYRVRGIHVEDLARLCVDLGDHQDINATLDAVGPQSPTFRQLVDAIRTAVDSHAIVVRVPGFVLPAMASALSLLMRDTLLTRDEYHAMANGLADSAGPSTGSIVFTDWVAEQGPRLGRVYANELDRHFRKHLTQKLVGGPT